MSERLDQLIGELQAVKEGVEELVIILDHLYRNREEIADLLTTKESKVESTICENCDAFCDSLAEALKKGWTNLQENDTLSANYSGLCPTCLETEYALDPPTFTKQVPESERAEFMAEMTKKMNEATEKQTELF